MRVTIITLVILCYAKLGISLLNKSNDLEMIVDVIKSYNNPTFVVANVCWTKLQKVKLVAELSNMETPKMIRFIDDNKIIEDFIHKESVIFLVDANCPFIEEFLRQANKTKKFRAPYRWLILEQFANQNNTVSKKLANLNILPDSEVIISQDNGNGGFIFHMIYKIKPESEWRLEFFGTWRTAHGIQKSNNIATVSNSMRRKNLLGEIIVTSLVITDNRTKDLYDVRDIKVDSVSKTGYRQIMALYYFMNATKAFTYPDTWGYYINGSWNGMIGDLVSGRAEIAGSVMFMTRQRIEFLDYLIHPTSGLTVKFVFREPPLSYQNNLYLLPFKLNVWLCIAAFVIILAFILYVNALWETLKSKISDTDKLDNSTLKPNVSDIAIVVISAMSQQGSAMELKVLYPSSISLFISTMRFAIITWISERHSDNTMTFTYPGTLGRVVTFILFLTFLFLYTSYSASIVALLQSSSKQIRTLSDLLHSKLELGAEDTPYNRYYFSTAKEPVRKAISQKVTPSGSEPNFLNLEDGIKKMQKKPFAFNMNLGTGYKLIERYFHEHEKCGLQEIDFIQDNIPWLSCRKHSPYKEILKVGLYRLQEHGLNNHENRMMYSKKPLCVARGGSFESVDILDCYPVLLMLLYGMILSFFVLIIEILFHRRQKLLRKIRDNC